MDSKIIDVQPMSYDEIDDLRVYLTTQNLASYTQTKKFKAGKNFIDQNL